MFLLWGAAAIAIEVVCLVFVWMTSHWSVGVILTWYFVRRAAQGVSEGIEDAKSKFEIRRKQPIGGAQ